MIHVNGTFASAHTDLFAIPPLAHLSYRKSEAVSPDLEIATSTYKGPDTSGTHQSPHALQHFVLAVYLQRENICVEAMLWTIFPLLSGLGRLQRHVVRRLYISAGCISFDELIL